MLPADYNPEISDLTSIAVENLMSTLRKKKIARRIIILDSCYSGLHRGGRAQQDFKKDFDEYELSLDRAFKQEEEGVAVLSSASINEKAREDKGHGFFTFSLLDALDELHKRAQKESVDISIDELHKLAFEKTVSLSEETQHPRFFYSTGAPICVFKRKAPRSKVPKGIKDHEAELRRLLIQLGNENQQLQKEAAEKIIKYGSKAVDGLVVRIGHRLIRVRELIVYCLGKIGDLRATEYLLGALRDRPLRSRKEPYTEKAIGALKQIGSDIVPIAMKYIEDEKKPRGDEGIKSHEIARILQAISDIWDGNEDSDKNGERIMDLIFDDFPKALLDYPNTDFVIEKVSGEFAKKIKNCKEEDESWKDDTTALYIISYMLKYAPRKIVEEIRAYPLFDKGYYFLRIVLDACNIIGGKESIRLVKGIKEKTIVRPKNGQQKSLLKLADQVIKALGS